MWHFDLVPESISSCKESHCVFAVNVWVSKEFSKEFPIIVPLSFLRTSQQYKMNLHLPDWPNQSSLKIVSYCIINLFLKGDSLKPLNGQCVQEYNQIFRLRRIKSNILRIGHWKLHIDQLLNWMIWFTHPPMVVIALNVLLNSIKIDYIDLSLTYG